jgi:acetylornithine deacetylase/succinyl-diaminopimelate desuccinylase-like protein
MDTVAAGEIRHDRILEVTRELIDLRMTTPERAVVGMRHMQAHLESAGIESRIGMFEGGDAPGKPLLRAAAGPEDARYTVCWHGHLDVVDVHSDATSLWTPTIRDGWLRGRGGLDMLGAVGCMAEGLVLAAPHLNAGQRDVRLILLLVGDEEQPPPHVVQDWWAIEGANVDFVISGEPTDLKVGNVTRSLRRLRFTVNGVGGHSGRGFMLQNPNRWARRLCELIEGLPRPVSDEYPTGPEYQQTVSISGSETTETSIPPEAKVVYTIRTIPGQSLDAVFATVGELVEQVIREMLADEADRGVERPPGSVPIVWRASHPFPAGRIGPDDPFVQALCEAARPAHPEGTQLLIAQNGAGDGAFTRRPADSYPDAVRGVECGLVGVGYHADEYVDTSSFVPYTEILLRHLELISMAANCNCDCWYCNNKRHQECPFNCGG